MPQLPPISILQHPTTDPQIATSHATTTPKHTQSNHINLTIIRKNKNGEHEMVIYPDDDYDDESLEFRKIQNKIHKKPDMSLLNKRALTAEEMDSLFLGD